LGQFQITIDISVLGVMHMHLPSSVTSTLPVKSVWDLQLSSPSVVTLLAGQLTMAREVTR
jgi:hypothetical protein